MWNPDRLRLRAALLALMGLMLSSCLLVDDFGDAWTQAHYDLCVARISRDLYYRIYNREVSESQMEPLARVLRDGDTTYLLLKENPDDAGGRLYRIAVDHGFYLQYRPVPTARERFTAEFPDSPISLRFGLARTPALTPEVLRELRLTAQHPGYWEIEDKALYNPWTSPACHLG